MNRNRLTSGLTDAQRRQYQSLTDEHERRLFLESLDVIDLTALPAPEQAAQTHPLPYSFLADNENQEPTQQALADTWAQLLTSYAAGEDKRHLRDLVNQLLRQQQEAAQQQAESVQAIVAPLIAQQQQISERIEELRGQVLKTADVESVMSRQVDANLHDVADRMGEAVERFVRKTVPAVVRVENPSEGLLRLTRYLTVGLVVAGLGLGGLLFWGLSARTKLVERTPGWMKYEYLRQKAQAEGDYRQLNQLNQAERLAASGTLGKTLSHLETINAARRQQQLFRQQETEHQQQLRQTLP